MTIQTDDRPTSRRAHAPRHAYATRGTAAMALAPERTAAPRPRPVERPDHLRVVAPADRARRRLTPGVAVLLSGVVFATFLALAVSHAMLVQGQVRLDELDAQLVEQQARYQELRTKVAELESPPRVVAEATAQGMVVPEDLQYLQPPAPDASAAGPTRGDEDEPPAGPAVGATADRAWSEVKPLLEAPGP